MLAEGLLSFGDIIHHITEAADYLGVPIVHPSDHIASVSRPEHAETQQSHPLHSLFSLQLPVLNRIVKSPSPLVVILHDGPSLPEQLSAMCKSLAVLPVIGTSSVKFVILVAKVMKNADSGRGGEVHRTLHDVKALVIDILNQLQRTGYIASFDVKIVPLEESCSSMNNGVGEECGPFTKVLLSTQSLRLIPSHRVIYLSQDIADISHAIMFYTQAMIAKAETTCSSEKYVDQYLKGRVYHNRFSGFFMESMFSNYSSGKFLSDGMSEEVDVIDRNLLCSNSLRYISFRSRGTNSVTYKPLSHFIVS